MLTLCMSSRKQSTGCTVPLESACYSSFRTPYKTHVVWFWLLINIFDFSPRISIQLLQSVPRESYIISPHTASYQLLSDLKIETWDNCASLILSHKFLIPSIPCQDSHVEMFSACWFFYTLILLENHTQSNNLSLRWSELIITSSANSTLILIFSNLFASDFIPLLTELSGSSGLSVLSLTSKISWYVLRGMFILLLLLCFVGSLQR